MAATFQNIIIFPCQIFQSDRNTVFSTSSDTSYFMFFLLVCSLLYGLFSVAEICPYTLTVGQPCGWLWTVEVRLSPRQTAEAARWVGVQGFSINTAIKTNKQIKAIASIWKMNEVPRPRSFYVRRIVRHDSKHRDDQQHHKDGQPRHKSKTFMLFSATEPSWLQHMTVATCSWCPSREIQLL